MKHQLKFAYRLLSKSDTLSSSLGPLYVGKIIKITNSDIKNIENKIINQTINLNTVSFVSWVQIKGIRYTTKQRMIIIIDVKDLPKFIIIKYIFFKHQCDIPFIIGQCINNLGFNEHFQAYEIENSDDLFCLSFDNVIIEHSPFVCSTMSNSCTYISCNF